MLNGERGGGVTQRDWEGRSRSVVFTSRCEWKRYKL